MNKDLAPADLKEWCIKNDLGVQAFDSLVNVLGYDNLEQILNLNDEQIEDACKTMKLTKEKQISFIAAIKTSKNKQSQISLQEWCTKNKLGMEVFNSLVNDLELTTCEEVCELNDEEIEEACNGMNLTQEKRSSFITAIKKSKISSDHNNDPFQEWCDRNELNQQYESFKSNGIHCVNHLIDLDEKEFENLCQKVGIKLGKKKEIETIVDKD